MLLVSMNKYHMVVNKEQNIHLFYKLKMNFKYFNRYLGFGSSIKYSFVIMDSSLSYIMIDGNSYSAIV